MLKSKKCLWGLTRLALQRSAADFRPNLAASWKPKSIQNDAETFKKSMLKNNTLWASIFKGFGRRFGKVAGWFFEPKTHAKSDWEKSAQQAKSLGKTSTKSMSALLQQMAFSRKSC